MTDPTVTSSNESVPNKIPKNLNIISIFKEIKLPNELQENTVPGNIQRQGHQNNSRFIDRKFKFKRAYDNVFQA